MAVRTGYLAIQKLLENQRGPDDIKMWQAKEKQLKLVSPSNLKRLTKSSKLARL